MKAEKSSGFESQLKLHGGIKGQVLLFSNCFIVDLQCIQLLISSVADFHILGHVHSRCLEMPTVSLMH